MAAPRELVGLWFRTPEGAVGRFTYEVATDLFMVEWRTGADDEDPPEDDVLYRSEIDYGGFEFFGTEPA